MQLICALNTKDKGIEVTSHTLQAKSLAHVMEVIEFDHPEVFNYLSKREYCIVLQPKADKEDFIVWQPDKNTVDFNFEVCYFLEIINGSWEWALAAAAYIAVAVTAVGTPLATLTVITLVLAVIIYVAAMVALSMIVGLIMQALSPTKTREQSAGNKSLIFSGIPNINTQGSYIPYPVGTYLCGGVIIARRIGTYSWTVTGDTPDPTLPTDLPITTKAGLSSIPEGVWYKLKSE